MFFVSCFLAHLGFEAQVGSQMRDARQFGGHGPLRVDFGVLGRTEVGGSSSEAAKRQARDCEVPPGGFGRRLSSFGVPRDSGLRRSCLYVIFGVDRLREY